jgi:intermediate cleaving peptidase 55
MSCSVMYSFVAEKTGPDGQHIFHLFVRPKNSKAELWDGARSGVQAALDVFNADEVSDCHGQALERR